MKKILLCLFLSIDFLSGSKLAYVKKPNRTPGTSNPVDGRRASGPPNVSTTKRPAGYFSEGFIRVFASSLSKKPHDLAELVKPGKEIANRMDDNGELAFLGDYATTWFHIFFQRLHYGSYNDTIYYMIYLKSFMEKRHKQCSAELNEIIDLADSMISNSDGRRIYALIDEYNQFPKVSKSGEQLCRELIEAFMKPYVRKKDTSLLQELVYNINYIDEGVQCDPSFETSTVDYNKVKAGPVPVARTKEEGFLTQAYLKFLDVIIKKKQHRVRDIFKHANAVYREKEKKNEFNWMLNLKNSIPLVITDYFQYTRIAIIKEEIPNRFYKKMKNRKIVFDEDTNDLIDFGNAFITEDQRDELFEIIDDFSRFPISNRTGKELCIALIDGFSKPFKENKKKLKFENFATELGRILKNEYTDEKHAGLFAEDRPGADAVYW